MSTYFFKFSQKYAILLHSTRRLAHFVLCRWISIIFMTLMSMLSYSNVKNTRAYYVMLQEPTRIYILRYFKYNVEYERMKIFNAR